MSDEPDGLSQGSTNSLYQFIWGALGNGTICSIELAPDIRKSWAIWVTDEARNITTPLAYFRNRECAEQMANILKMLVEGGAR